MTSSRHERNPEKTRSRILDAALVEFTANGFAGARVDAIAHRARVNKRMLYHYFGSKDGIYEEVQRTIMCSRKQLIAAMPEGISRSLPWWSEATAKNAGWVRLLEWEALETAGRHVMGESERRQMIREAIGRIEAAQAAGRMPKELDPAQLHLTLAAIVTFPFAFPQIVRMSTGLDPDDPLFLEKRTDFLKRFGEMLERIAQTPITPESDVPA